MRQIRIARINYTQGRKKLHRTLEKTNMGLVCFVIFAEIAGYEIFITRLLGKFGHCPRFWQLSSISLRTVNSLGPSKLKVLNVI